jgi:leader peptidase (prepilin peptidase)/N-methyltransferase
MSWVVMLEVLELNLELFWATVVVFSLCIGSFLNVVVYRLPLMMIQEVTEEYRDLKGLKPLPEPAFNLSYPRSSCPCCETQLKWWQNIPVLSYIILLGKCYSCETAISKRYPIIEVLTGVIGFSIAVSFGPTVECLFALLVSYMLIPLALIDYDQRLLPDVLTIPLIWLGLFANSFDIFTSFHSSFYGAIIGYCIPYILFNIPKLTRNKGMAAGDFKLMAAAGAILGVEILPLIVVAACFIFLLDSLFTFVSKNRIFSKINSFGPFLVLTIWSALLLWPNGDLVDNFISTISL